MTKGEEFVAFVDDLIENCKHPVTMSDNVKAYLDTLRNGTAPKEKPLLTDNGKLIMVWLQSAPTAYYKSKDIAEQVGLASKSVAGAMRKLITDGFVEKVGQDPVVYIITEKGKNIKIEE